MSALAMREVSHWTISGEGRWRPTVVDLDLVELGERIADCDHHVSLCRRDGTVICSAGCGQRFETRREWIEALRGHAWGRIERVLIRGVNDKERTR